MRTTRLISYVSWFGFYEGNHAEHTENTENQTTKHTNQLEEEKSDAVLILLFVCFVYFVVQFLSSVTTQLGNLRKPNHETREKKKKHPVFRPSASLCGVGCSKLSIQDRAQDTRNNVLRVS